VSLGLYSDSRHFDMYFSRGRKYNKSKMKRGRIRKENIIFFVIYLFYDDD
jgi:hypothetical protein